MNKQELLNIKISDLLSKYPFLNSFFKDNNLNIEAKENLSMKAYFDTFSEEDIEEQAIDTDLILEQISNFIEQMIQFLDEDVLNSLTILPGTDKFANKENFKKLKIEKGEIVCIVGPTGSGKSRLLADIEWVAQADTPTKRTILINDEKPSQKWRFSSSDKLVAQLSQNMNFVMDLTAYEFIELHAESRMIENIHDIVDRVIQQANELAGEPFANETPITSLSGGQSRALMIADTAILSKSPIVLIDELENAGIDRKKALSLLVAEDKIVLMATHDPILALMGNKRIVIKNGGINKIIDITDKERQILIRLEKMDKELLAYRTKLRQGEILEKISSI